MVNPANPKSVISIVDEVCIEVPPSELNAGIVVRYGLSLVNSKACLAVKVRAAYNCDALPNTRQQGRGD